VLQPTARRRVVVALSVYLALVARLTLWPSPAPSRSFDLVREVLAWLSRLGAPITYAGLEATANVLMFVPFGVLVGLLVRRRWLVVVLGLCLSGAIELTQLLLLPTSVPTVQDVVLNTVGAALGVLGLQAVRSLRARRRAAIRPATTG
jgi:glycopeptide antibiotics resistance protein